MRLRRCAPLALALLSLVLQSSASAGRPAVEGGCADVVDGFGRVAREPLPAHGFDVGGTLSFLVSFAAPTCPSVTYRLDVVRTADPTSTPQGEYVDVGTVEQRGDGTQQLRFELSYRDLAFARDPVDERGQDRCLWVVGRTLRASRELDRAPDAGMHVLCHRRTDGDVDDQGGTQAAFQ